MMSVITEHALIIATRCVEHIMTGNSEQHIALIRGDGS
jgi:hypothetical protein